MDHRATVMQIDPELAAAAFRRRFIFLRCQCRDLGAAATGSDGIRAARLQRPDLVILDLELPDLDGFEVLRELQQLNPTPHILLFTARSDEVAIYRIATSRVSGFVWKTPAGELELPLAIERILGGECYFSDSFHAAERRFRASPECFIKLLSGTELELMPLLGAGYSDREVATRVKRSPATIHCQRQSVLAKLGLHSTVELMRWATEKGFVHIPRPGPPCRIAG